MLNRYPGIFIFYLLIIGTGITACGPGRGQQHIDAKADTVSSNPPADPAAGKALSQQCTQCHGNDGAGSKNGAPFIAGQQPEYFKSAIKAYADGHRKNEDMQASTSKLKDKEIANLAAYYSGLESEWNSSRYKTVTVSTSGVSKTDVAHGKKIAGPCLSCHGEDGNSKQSGIPSLAGLSPDYLEIALKAYFNKTRQDTTMQTFSRTIAKSETRQLSAYLSTLTRNKPIATVSGNKKRGEKYSQKICTGCHGKNGNSLNPKIPSLTGQNAAYLVKAMQSYRNGTRKNAMMKTALKDVPHQSFADIAAFYAAQQPQTPGTGKQADSNKFDPIGEGKSLAATCNGCHGKDGNSTTAGIPSLTRLYPEYLESAINAYKTGTRKHDLMKSFISALGKDDIEKLGLYYATQTPAASPKPAKGDVKAGEQVALTCAGCHGEHGNSEQANVPSLAGQNAQYIMNALNAYSKATRQQADMQKVVKDFKPADMVNVAAYYAVQSPAKPKINPPENPIELSAKCDRCHGVNGYSAVLNIPRIGGQVESYLVKSLTAYKGNKRTNSAMHAMSDVLSNLEIRAIAHYYARQSKP